MDELSRLVHIDAKNKRKNIEIKFHLKVNIFHSGVR